MIKGLINNLKRPSEKTVIATIILLCFITRIPQLTSIEMILDGDECVVATMARHFYQGKHFPMFFIGQQYGFSFFECLAIIPFYALFGMKTIAVKLAMLCIWTTGIVFFYKTLAAINKKSGWIPFLVVLMFIATPAWAVWSMKARGGYLTAFLLNSVALYLLFNEKINKKKSTYFWLGIIIVLIYECQLLWLPGLIPLLLYRFINDKKWGHLPAFFIPAIVLFTTFYFYRLGLPSFYKTSVFIAKGDHLQWVFTRIPEYLFGSLHGNYFFNIFYTPYPYAAIAAHVFSVLVYGLPIVAIIFLFLRKKRWLFIISTTGILLALLLTTFTYLSEGRYLLPITGTTLFSLALLLNEVKAKTWIMATIFGIFIFIGFRSLYSFHYYFFCDTREKDFKNTLNTLQNEGIRYLFCLDDFMAWQVNFYSDEKVICRGIYMPGRYPAYTSRINKALFNKEKTAVFNTNNFHNEYKWKFDSLRIVDHYYVCVYPNIDTLKKTFQFRVQP